jgi:hypothetical protein
MKILAIIFISGLCLTAPAMAEPPAEISPAISLFDSANAVKAFLVTTAKMDYSDKYPSKVALQYFDGNPKQGLAWVYTFSFKRPQRGGDISIFHFMDGEIQEFHHGP